MKNKKRIPLARYDIIPIKKMFWGHSLAEAAMTADEILSQGLFESPIYKEKFEIIKKECKAMAQYFTIPSIIGSGPCAQCNFLEHYYRGESRCDICPKGKYVDSKYLD